MVSIRINNKFPIVKLGLTCLLVLSLNCSADTLLTLPELIHDSSEHFYDIDSADLDGLLKRIGDSRVVLLGESSHGTAEFYDMRARITRELIEKKGFTIVAVEADWPDAEIIDDYIHNAPSASKQGIGDRKINLKKPFTGFPRWMWANHSVYGFTKWLTDYNRSIISAEDKVGFYGLDLYDLSGSIDNVIEYLQYIDAKAAQAARRHYACLTPWAHDPSLYSRDMRSGRYTGCEYDVYAVWRELRNKRLQYITSHRGVDNRSYRERYFKAEQNARLAIKGERYFRTMYDSSSESWNQRDNSMFETLLSVMNFHGKTSKAVVWAHNSHIGDARATERSEHNEFNLGQKVREAFADNAYLIGFATDHGTVAAASEWGGPMLVMQIPPSHRDSYGYLFHQVKADNFLLPLRDTGSRDSIQDKTRKKLLTERLQRAIGTSYDPEDELRKHYIRASLPAQFDEIIWFDETQAVKPLHRER
ncbi:MAG: erythromycin esterase family protein [Gammaproteobacteria bacterium]|nr:erythromycin esterase family protein [Gammaproteobacteria bacterium]